MQEAKCSRSSEKLRPACRPSEQTSLERIATLLLAEMGVKLWAVESHDYGSTSEEEKVATDRAVRTETEHKAKSWNGWLLTAPDKREKHTVRGGRRF